MRYIIFFGFLCYGYEISACTTKGYILDGMPKVVDKLWTNVSDNWVFTTGANLATYFSRYDPVPKSSLNLYDFWFIYGQPNFYDEFKEFGVTRPFAQAYFRSLDVVESKLYMRLAIEDMDTIVDMVDKYTGGVGLGFVSGTQFKKGFKQLIFRGLPFSLLFYNYTSPMIPIVIPKMRFSTFHNILLDIDANGQVTGDEMAKFWDKGCYGPPEIGGTLFASLNYQNKTFLSLLDWNELFNFLDCVNENDIKDGRLTHREFLQMDDVLHGTRRYPEDECRNVNGQITPLIAQKKGRAEAKAKIKKVPDEGVTQGERTKAVNDSVKNMAKDSMKKVYDLIKKEINSVNQYGNSGKGRNF